MRLVAFAAVAVACLNGRAAWAILPSDALLQRLQPQGPVSDFAGLLTPADRAAIENRLSELRRRNRAQLALVTLPSLEGGQIDDFTNKLFRKWGVGEKGKNNGVMLLVAIQDRKARIEPGYGLEPILPDALAGRVLDEQLFPAFRQGHYVRGITQAVNRIAEIIERGQPASPQNRQATRAVHSDAPFAVVILTLFFGPACAVLGVGIGARQLAPLFFGCVVLIGVCAFCGPPLLAAWVHAGIGFWVPIVVGAIAFLGGWLGASLARQKGPPGRKGRQEGDGPMEIQHPVGTGATSAADLAVAASAAADLAVVASAAADLAAVAASAAVAPAAEGPAAAGKRKGQI